MRVIVTRSRAQAEPLAERLRELGHDVVLCPLLEIEALGEEPVEVEGYDWVVVTSANGAEELARRFVGTMPKLAAVGPGTAETLRRHGLEPDFVPTVSTQEGLAEELPRPAGRVLVAAAEGARRLLEDELGADFVALYRTHELTPTERPEGDLVVLASGSAARAFAALRVDIPAVSIGPQTTIAAEAAGLEVVSEAATHDLDGLVVAVRSAPCSSPS